MAHRKLAILRRRLFAILSVVSLLLCIATLALWGRSYWYCDGIDHIPSSYRYWSFQSLRGQLDFASYSSPNEFETSFEAKFYRTTAATRAATAEEVTAELGGSGWFGGFGFAFPDGMRSGYRVVGIPHWFLVLLFAILPALRLQAILRSRRHRREGLCPICGYDLRATPDRCPECGTVVQRSEGSDQRSATQRLTSDL